MTELTGIVRVRFSSFFGGNRPNGPISETLIPIRNTETKDTPCLGSWDPQGKTPSYCFEILFPQQVPPAQEDVARRWDSPQVWGPIFGVVLLRILLTVT